MGYWDVIIPEATTNLITNPSFEVATTGWTAPAGTLARSTDDPVSGVYNGKFTPDAAVTDGFYTTFSATSGVTYTFSIYVKGVTSIPYRIFFSNAGFTNISDITTFTGDGTWHRYEETYTAEATETLFCYVTKNSHASTDPFYVDAAQCEVKAYATSYCDGSIAPPKGFASSGCSWNGIAHASTSTRKASSRAGGRIRSIEDDYHFIIQQSIGVAAPMIENYSTAYALLDGSLYEHGRIAQRTFALSGVLSASSYQTFLQYRGALYSAVQPMDNDEPLLLRFTGGTTTLEISAYYDGGLEGGNMYALTEQITLRFLACDPNWREVIV